MKKLEVIVKHYPDSCLVCPYKHGFNKVTITCNYYNETFPSADANPAPDFCKFLIDTDKPKPEFKTCAYCGKIGDDKDMTNAVFATVRTNKELEHFGKWLAAVVDVANKKGNGKIKSTHLDYWLTLFYDGCSPEYAYDDSVTNRGF